MSVLKETHDLGTYSKTHDISVVITNTWYVSINSKWHIGNHNKTWYVGSHKNTWYVGTQQNTWYVGSHTKTFEALLGNKTLC